MPSEMQFRSQPMNNLELLTVGQKDAGEQSMEGISHSLGGLSVETGHARVLGMHEVPSEPARVALEEIRAKR